MEKINSDELIISQTKKKIIRNLNKINCNNKMKIKILIYILIIFVFIFCYYFNIKNKEIENIDGTIINEPIIPLKIEQYIKKKYHISESNFSHSRYHFQEIYYKRKLFSINYSFSPYEIINKYISYDKNAEKIFDSTGMLNITKLDYYYYNIDINTLNLNHIHLAMGFDKNNIILSTVSIASILNTSSQDTYIHFHILALNFKFKYMKKIIQLKRINKNVDFVFYNAKQVEYDFLRNNYTQLNDYIRILAPKIVNNTNKILILDSIDIIAQKDISEVYYFDLENNYFSWILEDVAGNEEIQNIFLRNNFYPNAEVCLVNVRLFREDNLYRTAFYLSKSFKEIPLPFQDIFSMIPIYKFKYMPLKYNCMLIFEDDEQIRNKTKNKIIENWINNQRFSPYNYSLEEIFEAASDPVISHSYRLIIKGNVQCNKATFQWIKYAKLSGFYKEIKQEYPLPFNCENYK